MTNIQKFFRQVMVALAIGMASLGAHAGVLPSWHVTIDTRSLTGAGFLDLTFNSFVGDPGALATVTSLGGVDGIDLIEGQVANPGPGTFLIANDPGLNLLSHAVTFGGLLSFDVAFSGDFLTVFGDRTSVFSAALLDSNLDAIGTGDPVVQFNVTQLGLGGPASVAFATDIDTGGFGNVTVNAVPEPSDLLLMLTGLALLGAVVRRRA